MKELNINEIETINGGSWSQAGEALIGSLQIAYGVGEGIVGFGMQDPMALQSAGDNLSQGIQNVFEA